MYHSFFEWEKLLTQFIEHERVCLYSLTELVGFTAHQHWYTVRLGYQCNLRAANTWHDETIGQQSMCSKKHLGHLKAGTYALGYYMATGWSM